MNGQGIVVRTFESDASAVLLHLNNAHAEDLSPLSAATMMRVVDHAFFAGRIGEADAFLIALDQDADYDSPNFLWFREQFERFVYVDRIAVAPAARGRGLAKALYAALIAEAHAAGHDRVVCEVNAEPPNPASDGLHAALGFVAAGAASLAVGKTVRYYVRALARPDADGAIST